MAPRDDASRPAPAARLLLSWTMRLLVLAALLSFGVLAALAAWTPPFPHKRIVTAFFALAAAEKIWGQVLRRRDAAPLAGERDWTAAAVAAAYLGVMYLALFEWFHACTGIRYPLLAGFGVAVYLAALGLQYRAWAHLRHQWAVHLDRPVAGRTLIRTGPYGVVRHPLYVAYCLEALSIPLVLHAFGAFSVAILAFVPLEALRARYEERLLRRTFGQAYEAYAREVGAILPRRARGLARAP